MSALALTTLLRIASQEERTDTPWQHDALCLDADPAVFFPEDVPQEADREDTAAYARSLCSRCPVRTACLDDALATEQPRRRGAVLSAAGRHGIRGGLDPDERAALARQRAAGRGVV